MKDSGVYCQSLTFENNQDRFKSELCIVSSDFSSLQKEAESFLHQSEKEYYQQLAYEKRQLSFLLGHYTAKNAIVRHQSGINLNQVRIDYGFFQNPIVDMPDKSTLHVSYSHSMDKGIAVTFEEAFPMGVDLEQVQEKILDLKEMFMSEDDCALYDAIQSKNPAEIYTLFWTAKEAISKALRTGMTAPLTVYALKNLRFKNDSWVSEFKNFSQYKAITFILGQYVCSIVYPKLVEIEIDVNAIKEWANGLNL